MSDTTTPQELEPQPQDYPNEFDYWENYADYWKRRAERAKMERDALAQALHSYGEHRDYCRSGEFTREVDAAGNAVPYPCTCGFEGALERYPLATKEKRP